MRYQVQYDDGSSITVELPGMHEPAVRVIEKAAIELRAAGKPVPTPVRIATVAQGAIGEDIGTDRVIWTGPVPKQAESLTLFMSYAYLEDGSPRYGNALIEMSAEPTVPDHVEHVQQLIEQQTERQAVILLGWQRVGR